MTILKSWLAHPLTKGLKLDTPETTSLRRQIIREKIYLRCIYEEWYKSLVRSIPERDGFVLEVGAGAGFFKDILPDVITSECFYLSGIDLVLDGGYLPFKDGSLKAIVMTDVFHHLPKPRLFLCEAIRCLSAGGVVVMLEPWVTPWSRFVYTRFHHEPFHPDAKHWEFEAIGPLTSANGALPWIIFQRDREKYESEFQQMRVHSIEPMMPFLYIFSGGISLINLQPGWTFGFWRYVESLFTRWTDHCAMFSKIVLWKVDDKKQEY